MNLDIYGLLELLGNRPIHFRALVQLVTEELQKMEGDTVAQQKHDSIQSANSQQRRLHHSAQTRGKLRHTSHDDLTLLKTASIPSRFTTVVVDNSDKRGFGAQARRFNYDPNSDTPGPAAYVDRTAEALNFLRSPSFSQKGAGGLASKTQRKFDHLHTATPGPAAYNVRMNFSKSDFTVGNGRNFCAPLAVTVEKLPETPAPNAYSPNREASFKQNNVSAYAAFKSRTKREIVDHKAARSAPAPGTYNVKDDLVHDAVRVPHSSFKTNGERKYALINSENPPPGAYHPFEPVSEKVNRQVLPRRHYLGLSVPAIPPPRTPPGPGPGQYETSFSWGEPRHYMSSSMFVSNSSRWARFASNAEFPGPAHYHPTGQRKQSHIFNADKKWIPT